VFCPADCLGLDPLILNYAINFPGQIVVIEENKRYQVGNFEFLTSVRHIHPAETYGIKFNFHGRSVALLSDTRYFPELADFYRVDLLIISVVFYQPRPGVDHLSFADVESLLDKIRPKRTILSHFGMTMLKAKPHLLAEDLSARLKLKVAAAYDGMTLTDNDFS
jgi:phosphoribosyl 1,2-cyclic phosphodiesterase